MKIEMIPIAELTPYENNTRKHGPKDIAKIKLSIEQFGMNDPIGIWGDNNTIVEGHGRVLALQELGWTDAPCIRLDHMTDDQRKAYTIAHNKTAEFSKWDFEKLAMELNEINIDMGDFELELPSKINGKDEYIFSLNNLLNLEYGQFEGSGEFDIPKLDPIYLTNEQCEELELMGFNYCKSTTKSNVAVHFFIHDYQFERVWNDPPRYSRLISKFKYVCTPDFSQYTDMPTATKIWNIYRKNWCGRYWQSLGLKVIPTVTFSDLDNIKYSLDGIPTNSTVIISTINSQLGTEEFETMWNIMLEKIKPRNIMLYGIKDAKAKVTGNVIFKSMTGGLYREKT